MAPSFRSTAGALLAVLVLSACGAPAPKSTSNTRSNVMPASIEDRARAFIGELAASQWDHPHTAFDDAMTSAATPSSLEQIWKSLEAKGSRFQRIEAAHVTTKDKYQVVDLVCVFERAKLTLRVSFDEQNRLAGMFVVPDKKEVAWSAPSYADARTFEERDVKVGASPPLPGTLTLPKGPGPFAAVVLVHGSGPNDRDETIGALKPFKDLAWGLASRGVAVLRYEKRSRVSPAGIVTQRDEVEGPAGDAIRLLQSTPAIDPRRVFLAGHSQGGYLAPRIAAAHPTLGGVVILAGSTRPLEDSIVDQLAYFIELSPGDASLKPKLAAARAFKERVEAEALRPDEDVAFPIGGSRAKGAYFLDVRGYDPAAVAKTLACRLLVLQGDRDYQVTTKDFDRWRASLGGSPSATLRTYPGLNHAFVHGSGPPSPAEYMEPGNVDVQVVDQIASWINAR
jgi:pimeloyl-ACP methyl ester carboxylesterase